jgi:hypothetical protein
VEECGIQVSGYVLKDGMDKCVLQEKKRVEIPFFLYHSFLIIALISQLSGYRQISVLVCFRRMGGRGSTGYGG